MSDRRTGKIARLPFAVRTTVNEKLRDGVPYAAIIKGLEEEGHYSPGAVNEQNLTNWAQGGHQDWLKEQERLADMTHKREFALRIVQENEGSKLHEANLHLVASQIYETLTEFDLAGLKEGLADKPLEYTNLVNAIAKVSKGNVELQKYKDTVREQKEKILAATNAAMKKGGITEETRQTIVDAAALL